MPKGKNSLGRAFPAHSTTLYFIFHLQLCSLLYVVQRKPALSNAKLLWGEKSSSFLWKNKVSALVLSPTEPWKKLTSATKYLTLSTEEKDVQNCSLQPQAGPGLWCLWTSQQRFLLFSQRKHLQPGFFLPCMLPLLLNCDPGVTGVWPRDASPVWGQISADTSSMPGEFRTSSFLEI